MKRDLLFSLGGHIVLVLVIWLGDFSFSSVQVQGYPVKINATVVDKSSVRSKAAPLPQKQAAPPENRMEVNEAPLPRPTPVTPPAKKSSPQKEQKKAPPQPAASAPATSAMSLDVDNFPFPEYLQLLQYRIERQWRPPISQTDSWNTLIRFRVARNGKLLEAAVEKSSGNFTFDQAALRAVYNADPLPALPEAAGLQALGVHFEFVGGK